MTSQTFIELLLQCRRCLLLDDDDVGDEAMRMVVVVVESEMIILLYVVSFFIEQSFIHSFTRPFANSSNYGLLLTCLYSFVTQLLSGWG